MVSGVVGAAFVTVSCAIAPNRQKELAVVLAALTIFVSGGLVYSSLLQEQYWPILNNVCLDVGAMSAAYVRCKSETDTAESAT